MSNPIKLTAPKMRRPLTLGGVFWGLCGSAPVPAPFRWAGFGGAIICRPNGMQTTMPPTMGGVPPPSPPSWSGACSGRPLKLGAPCGASATIYQ